jgi:hypothetical protein
VVEIASGTVKHRLVSVSERMSMLFERDLAVRRIERTIIFHFS